MNAADRFVMNQADMPPLEFMDWLDDAATLQGGNSKISTQMDAWVPGVLQFRGHKEAIAREWQNAVALHVETTGELEAAIAAAIEDVNINAGYRLLRAKHEKDDAWLHNNGYQCKEKTKRNYEKTVSAVALVIKAKNGPNTAEVTLSWDRDPGAGPYLLQICKGHPQGEQSYSDFGYLKKVRVVIGALERACWYYFRVRSVGNNELGPWSEPVSIIVT